MMERPLAVTGSILQVTRRPVIWLPVERRPIRPDWVSIRSGHGVGLLIGGSSITGPLLIWAETHEILKGRSLNGMLKERDGSVMCRIMLFHLWARMEPIHSL